jgi:hypothetical protein
MFNKQPANSKNYNSKKNTRDEEFTFSFFGLKFSVKNPGWKTVILGVLFLIAVIIIVFRLHE